MTSQMKSTDSDKESVQEYLSSIGGPVRFRASFDVDKCKDGLVGSFTVLPLELLVNILQFLPFEDLVRAVNGVCKSWQHL